MLEGAEKNVLMAQEAGKRSPMTPAPLCRNRP